MPKRVRPPTKPKDPMMDGSWVPYAARREPRTNSCGYEPKPPPAKPKNIREQVILAQTAPRRLLLPPLRTEPVNGWSKEWAEQVIRYRAAGLTYAQCAALMDVNPSILTKWFARELEIGHKYCVAAVGGTLIAKALDGDVSCMQFYLKTQGGWKETTRNEVTGADGGPIQTAALVLDGKDLNDEQRDVLRHALQIAVHGKITDG